MKKRVLFITNLPASYKIDFFAELGKKVALTVLFERRQAKNRDKRWNAASDESVFHSHWLSGIDFGQEMSFAPSVLKYLRQKNYDIVLVNGYSSPTEMLAIAYLKLKKMPYALICDGLLDKKESKWKHKFKSFFINGADYYLSSGRMTDSVLMSYGVVQEKLFRYPFSSVKTKDIASVPYDRDHYKSLIGCKSRYMILYVGQMIHRKGIDVLQEAMHSLDDDYTLYLIGGTESDLLHPDAKTVVIDFMSRKDLEAYYKAADVFVLPTREDIWGLVVNEALGYAVPVVSTARCGAALEMIENYRNGVVLDALRPDALTDAIKVILHHPAPEQYMTCAVASAGQFTVEEMAKAVYRAIIR